MRKYIVLICLSFLSFFILLYNTNQENNKTILVTSFETFSGEFNISEEIMKELPEKIKDYKLIKVVLPVEWEKSNSLLDDYVNEYKPKYIISMGEKIGDNIVYEEFATNQQNGLADNIGDKKTNKENYKELKTNFNLKNVQTSNTIGKYICNSLYYNMLEKHSEIPSVFIHIGKQVDIKKAKEQFLREWSDLVE